MHPILKSCVNRVRRPADLAAARASVLRRDFPARSRIEVRARAEEFAHEVGLGGDHFPQVLRLGTIGSAEAGAADENDYAVITGSPPAGVCRWRLFNHGWRVEDLLLPEKFGVSFENVGNGCFLQFS